MKQHHTHRRLSAARWRLRDSTLTVLLAVQIVVIFGLGPLLAFGLPVSRTLTGFVFAIVIFVVIVATPSLGPMIAIIVALVFDAASVALVKLPNATVPIYWMNGFGSLLSIAGVSWVVINLIFSPGPMDRHRIIGAIVLYLNVALAFGALYRLVLELSPGAFTGLRPSLLRGRIPAT